MLNQRGIRLMDRSAECHVADVLIIDLHPQTVLIRRRLEVPGKVGETFAIDCSIIRTIAGGATRT